LSVIRVFVLHLFSEFGVLVLVATGGHDIFRGNCHSGHTLRPGFHPNAIGCVACVWTETELNASDCVGKQPIMVATASTEHPIGC